MYCNCNFFFSLFLLPQTQKTGFRRISQFKDMIQLFSFFYNIYRKCIIYKIFFLFLLLDKRQWIAIWEEFEESCCIIVTKYKIQYVENSYSNGHFSLLIQFRVSMLPHTLRIQFNFFSVWWWESACSAFYFGSSTERVNKNLLRSSGWRRIAAPKWEKKDTQKNEKGICARTSFLNVHISLSFAVEFSFVYLSECILNLQWMFCIFLTHFNVSPNLLYCRQLYSKFQFSFFIVKLWRKTKKYKS